MAKDSSPAQGTISGMDHLSERLSFDRPNLDKKLVRILLLLGASVVLLHILPLETSNDEGSHPEAKASVPAYVKEYAINVGSDCAYTATDGVMYLADAFYTQDMAQRYYLANWTTLRLSDGGLANTADPTLYFTERWGAFNYTLPNLENGIYQVSIHLAENYWREPKKRGFYIQVQNNPMEGPIDIVARAGAYKTAYIFTNKAYVTDHTLLIQFLHIKPDEGFEDNGALANAIRVVHLAPEAVSAAASAAAEDLKPHFTDSKSAGSQGAHAAGPGLGVADVKGSPINIASDSAYDPADRVV
eukprot:TRINITY_DN4931_c0_g1_i1.p1 TRINITY_DN4931_c0_g1~~TRINITY_DN4931_c0_g1_i1.p1  ORF type:complete len:301 (-),score=61.44 TRINITY_DN4931_c0_g1_i1:876-1778(-)